MIEWLLVFLSVIATSGGLLFFKKFSVSVDTKSLDVIVKTAFNRYFVFSVISILISSIFFIMALSRIDLAVAYTFTSLTNIFVLIGAVVFLNERVFKFHIIGIVLIVAGLMIFHIQ